MTDTTPPKPSRQPDEVPRRDLLDMPAEIAAGEAPPPEPERFERLIAKIYKQTRKTRRKNAAANRDEETRALQRRQAQADRERNRREERALIDATFMSAIHDGTAVEQATQGESPGRTARMRPCYTCPNRYDQVDGFYHMLCPECAALNLARRNKSVDLHGRIALVTGGRIKIGYQTALKLLRNGAHVVVTTRFARDAALRYQAEADFAAWGDRLEIFALDFTNLPAVCRFADAMGAHLPHLDILINNAAQSVRRQTDFYQKEIALEHGALDALPAPAQALLGKWDQETRHAAPFTLPPHPVPESNETNRVPITEVAVDRHGQPIDRREQHSWTYRLDEVPPGEMVEVLFVNSAAPAMLTGRLKPLLLRAPTPDRYVVNVGGLDGRFHSYSKNEKHPHVNMSKAALNMMTRTVAQDWERSGIYMTSVDTGWVSHEGRYATLEKLAEKGFRPPLDEEDGAARILDPVFRGCDAEPEYLHGVLLRNYAVALW